MARVSIVLHSAGAALDAGVSFRTHIHYRWKSWREYSRAGWYLAGILLPLQLLRLQPVLSAHVWRRTRLFSLGVEV